MLRGKDLGPGVRAGACQGVSRDAALLLGRRERSSTRIAPDAARDVISSRSRTPMSWKPCAIP